MKLAGQALIREIDRYAIDELGIASAELMTRAAGHIAAAAAELLPRGGGRVAVFCGSGNNGGDGMAAAALLLRRGLDVRVFLVTPRGRMSADTSEMERRLSGFGVVPEEFDGGERVREFAASCDVIIDAIFGVGVRDELTGGALEAVRLINSSGAGVVAADMPSGVETDTGRICGEAARADITVTFSLAKPGHFLPPGCLYCGEVRVCDIGVPGDVISAAASKLFTVGAGDITLPARARDTHKGDYGRGVIFAGSVGCTGAPALAARAASRTGAGLVYVCVPRSVYGIVAAKCDVEMVFPLECAEDGGLSENAPREAADRIARCDAVLAGPGLGTGENVKKLIFELLTRSKMPLILDADGINVLAGNIDILKKATCPVVLTPHDGEFSRLTGGEHSGDRLGAAVDFAVRYGCILVLKGYHTITALPDGCAYINTTGGPALAKGGSGDVLAGIILSLAGQGFPLKDAALSAVYLHGAAGDMCADRYGEYGVTATDIIEALPETLKRHTRGQDGAPRGDTA
ncbi:MAG: NAD(P)H-hydrate dehydratase [Oscillospiraceae bacterium]|jgi:NAD(P)H-hydrate epimerase|nr:NAD(P)H-hydrate dehydratase [Oscillospiraceae bacterium]